MSRGIPMADSKCSEASDLRLVHLLKMDDFSMTWRDAFFQLCPLPRAEPESIAQWQNKTHLNLQEASLLYGN
jgi:hypothetical protein